MPRTRRYAPGGMVFHALNRGVGRMEIFSKDEDCASFEKVIEETLRLGRAKVDIDLDLGGGENMEGVFRDRRFSGREVQHGGSDG